MLRDFDRSTNSLTAQVNKSYDLTQQACTVGTVVLLLLTIPDQDSNSIRHVQVSRQASNPL